MARTLPKGRNIAIPDEVSAALATLRESMKTGASEKVPNGWRTAVQWAEAWKVSRGQALIYIRHGIETGSVETRKYVVRTGSLVRAVPHYFVKTAPR